MGSPAQPGASPLQLNTLPLTQNLHSDPTPLSAGFKANEQAVKNDPNRQSILTLMDYLHSLAFPASDKVSEKQ